MAFWNFTHDALNMHVYLLPSIVVGIGMLVTGLVHGKNQKKRQDDYNKQLQGETSEAKTEG